MPKLSKPRRRNRRGPLTHPTNHDDSEQQQQQLTLNVNPSRSRTSLRPAPILKSPQAEDFHRLVQNTQSQNRYCRNKVYEPSLFPPDTPVLSLFRHGWENLLSPPGTINDTAVVEFYANMEWTSGDTFKTSVNNNAFRVDLSTLESFFDLPNDDIDQLDVHAHAELLMHPLDERSIRFRRECFARLFVASYPPEYRYPGFRVTSHDLNALARVLFNIVQDNFCQRIGNRDELNSVDVVLVSNFISANRRFSVARFVMEEMREKHRLHRVLPFAPFISAFCARQGYIYPNESPSREVPYVNMLPLRTKVKYQGVVNGLPNLVYGDCGFHGKIYPHRPESPIFQSLGQNASSLHAQAQPSISNHVVSHRSTSRHSASPCSNSLSSPPPVESTPHISPHRSPSPRETTPPDVSPQRSPSVEFIQPHQYANSRSQQEQPQRVLPPPGFDDEQPQCLQPPSLDNVRPPCLQPTTCLEDTSVTALQCLEQMFHAFHSEIIRRIDRIEAHTRERLDSLDQSVAQLRRDIRLLQDSASDSLST